MTSPEILKTERRKEILCLVGEWFESAVDELALYIDEGLDEWGEEHGWAE